MKPGIVVLFLLIIAVGCNTSPAVTSTSVALPPATATGTAPPTRTSRPSKTPIPTVTITNTPMPTLTTIESESHVKELLEDNGGCSLPCIWGIEPGVTSYAEAQRFFEFLGWRGSELYTVYDTGKDLESVSLPIRVSIYAGNGGVEKLHIGIGGKDFLSQVKYFSFDNILQMYGKPTEVLVFIGVTPGFLEPNKTSFELLLYYQEKSVLVEFAGTAVKFGNSYRFCPARPNAESTEEDPRSGWVSLYVGEKNQPSTPENLVRPFWELPNYYISAENAFGMSVDEFYETVSQNDGDTCFNSPLDAWRR